MIWSGVGHGNRPSPRRLRAPRKSEAGDVARRTGHLLGASLLSSRSALPARTPEVRSGRAADHRDRDRLYFREGPCDPAVVGQTAAAWRAFDDSRNVLQRRTRSYAPAMVARQLRAKSARRHLRRSRSGGGATCRGASRRRLLASGQHAGKDIWRSVITQIGLRRACARDASQSRRPGGEAYHYRGGLKDRASWKWASATPH